LTLQVFGPEIKDAPKDEAAVIVAIGDNHTRKNVCKKLTEDRITFFTAIHPNAIIGGDVLIGSGTMISANVVISTGSSIGDHVILNTACSVDHHNRISDYTHIAPGVHLGGSVSVGEGALIGIGSVVLPGLSIGAWAVIGGGSVVTRDVPARAVVYGNPAKVMRMIPEL
jgi:sugar O-acyltransferase (sialic acid O-acetyltransferase NeuD family)